MNIISPESQKILNLYEQMLIQHQHQRSQASHQSQLSLHIKSPTNTPPATSSGTNSSNSSLCSSKSQQSSPSNSSESPPPTNQQPISEGSDMFMAENSYRAYVAAALAAAANSFSSPNAAAAAVAAAYQNQFVKSQSTTAEFGNEAAHGYSYMSRLFGKPVHSPQPGSQPQTQQPIPNTSFKARGNSSSSSSGVDEPPKPAHSYIGLIAIAILSSPEKRLVLSDIYQYILDNYSYFHNRGSGWRNSIRHNLSLNDCFMKAGRSANGKGHYWTIHPANLDDFSRGDFRRRRAQRRVRRSLGLTVPEEDDEDDEDITVADEVISPSSLSPSPRSSAIPAIQPAPFMLTKPPATFNPVFYNRSGLAPFPVQNPTFKRAYECELSEDETEHKRKMFKSEENQNSRDDVEASNYEADKAEKTNDTENTSDEEDEECLKKTSNERKRSAFDVETLLAPDNVCKKKRTESDGDKQSRGSKPRPKSVSTSTSSQHRSALKTGADNSNSPFSKVQSDNQDVEKWKQTFSKIMARSYKNNPSSSYAIGLAKK